MEKQTVDQKANAIESAKNSAIAQMQELKAKLASMKEEEKKLKEAQKAIEEKAKQEKLTKLAKFWNDENSIVINARTSHNDLKEIGKQSLYLTIEREELSKEAWKEIMQVIKSKFAK